MQSMIFGAISAILAGGVAFAVAYMAPSKQTACEPVAMQEGYDEGEKSLADEEKQAKAPEESKEIKDHIYYAEEDVAFVNLEPMVVTLGPRAKSKYLKISIAFETSSEHEEKLKELAPKLRDVLNTYLRAVEESDLADPKSMNRLRAQMLRRVQIVADQEAVNDVLITDFVLT